MDKEAGHGPVTLIVEGTTPPTPMYMCAGINTDFEEEEALEPIADLLHGPARVLLLRRQVLVHQARRLLR